MQIFLQNLAGGTFIRVGTLIRHCIVSVGVAMEEKKFCPAGTSGGHIKWRHQLTTCRVAIKKMVTEHTCPLVVLVAFFVVSGSPDLLCFDFVGARKYRGVTYRL